MKTLIAKLLPGVVATLAVLIAGAWLHAQTPTPQIAPAPAPAPEMARGSEAVPVAPHVHAPAGAPAAPVLLCGACGESLQAPRPVLVAEPTYADRRRAAAGYAWAHGSPRIPDPRHFPDYYGAPVQVAQVPIWPQPLFSSATVTAPVFLPAPGYYGRGYVAGCR